MVIDVLRPRVTLGSSLGNCATADIARLLRFRVEQVAVQRAPQATSI
jgi:hypothetical protein